MNKSATMLFSLLLSACSSRPPMHGIVDTEGAQWLAEGVVAYHNDHFLSARKRFKNALSIYQSVDDSRGVQLARINLIETALAISDFSAAEKHLAILKQQAANGFLEPSLKDRVELLEIKSLFKQRHYSEALMLVESILMKMDVEKLPAHHRLELLATAARLEALTTGGSKHRRIDEFRELMPRDGVEDQEKIQVLSKRIDAVIAAEQRRYQEALTLLHQALSYYKTQMNRRAIAACLEEVADIEYRQHHFSRTMEYLTRALDIRVWLKDQYHAKEIRKKMAQIDATL